MTGSIAAGHFGKLEAAKDEKSGSLAVNIAAIVASEIADVQRRATGPSERCHRCELAKHGYSSLTYRGRSMILRRPEQPSTEETKKRRKKPVVPPGGGACLVN